MPKNPTFPILLDKVVRISISELKRFRIFQEGRCKTKTITWYENGIPIEDIEITVDLSIAASYVELNYSYGNPISYRVRLVKKQSNLGCGNIWYFVCPRTAKRCRILYRVGTHFLHREAYKGAMYQSQTISRYWRPLKLAFLREDRPTRTHYRGKPTKRYRRWLGKVERASSHFEKSHFMG